jgi:SAM-dependent methyltransferase
MAAYYFGVYHWRRRLRSVASATGMVCLAALFRRRWSLGSTALAAALATGATARGIRALSRVLSPPPWTIERYKYNALAARLPLGENECVLDVGCGTGRSLVGLAPYLPSSATVLGLDVFDDRVILGNAPGLARRNAAIAGLDAMPIEGDGTCLPIASGSVDTVAACRVLHDLPAASIDPALRELHRVCGTDGVIGVLELPLTPGGVDADPESYWRERVLDAGFEIERLDRVDRKGRDDQYVLLIARPT